MSEQNYASNKIALVTGANSGVGLETAYQLASTGFIKVILACRTHEKSVGARKQLIERGAADVFATLACDMSETQSAANAGQELLARGDKLSLLVLNAGTAGGSAIIKNSDGVDQTFASTLIGHHALTMVLLNGRGVADNGRIIIAGSEAARGDVLGMTIPDLDVIVRTDFAGNTHDMLKAFAMASYPHKYVASTAYAMAKLYAAWWAAELAPKLPRGIAVYAVSPGNTPSTNMGRDLPWPVRKIALPVLNIIGPFVGMAHSVAKASQRYVDASRFGVEQSGKFFASPDRKLTGPVVEQRTKHLLDVGMRTEAYKLIVEWARGLDFAGASRLVASGLGGGWADTSRFVNALIDGRHGPRHQIPRTHRAARDEPG